MDAPSFNQLPQFRRVMNTRIVHYKHRITLWEWVHIVQKAIDELIEGGSLPSVIDDVKVKNAI